MSKKTHTGKIKIFDPLYPSHQVFTKWQADEFEHCANDFEYFARTYVKIQNVDKGMIPFNIRPYQQRMANLVINNRFTIFNAPRQALHIEEDIPTPTGFSKMKDLRVGDYVLGADGKPTKITDVTDIMRGNECFRITFSTGESIISDGDHLWEVQYEDPHCNRPTKIMTTSELSKRKLTSNKNFKWFSVKTSKALELPEIVLPINPYIFGVWLGDGTSSIGAFTVHLNELQHFVQEIKNNGENIVSIREGRKNIFTVTVEGLQKKLRKEGLLRNKHIPQIYLRASYAQRLSLLQGLMDTDGYCGTNGHCEISSSYPILAEDICELAASLGLKISRTIHKTRASKFTSFKNSLRITFTAFSNEIPVFRLQRKLDRMKKDAHQLRIQSTKKRSISSIEPVESMPVKCIAVDNADHLYLVGKSFIPTHNCGKTAMITALLLWYMIFNTEFHIGVGSNKMSSAKQVISRLKFAYEEMPMWLKPAVKSYNKQDIEFENNSSIESNATTGDGLRSKTFNIIYLDEFSHIKPKIAEDFWTSTFPVISSGTTTQVIITSTPNGTEGIYAQLWFSAVDESNGFAYSKIEASEIEGRDEEFKEKMLKKMGINQYLQEFEGAFLSSKGTLINSMILENIKKKPVIKQFKDTRFFSEPFNRSLIIGIDVGTGIGQDYHTIQIFDKLTFEQVGEFRDNMMNQTMFSHEIISLLNYLDTEENAKQIYWGIESNSYGLGVINMIQNSNHPVFSRKYVIPIVTYGNKEAGIQMNSKSKNVGCTKFKDLVENRIMTLGSEKLLSELKCFVKTGASFKAETGKKDDLVMGCVVVALMLIEIAREDLYIDKKVNELQMPDSGGDGDGQEGYMPIMI